MEDTGDTLLAIFFSLVRYSHVSPALTSSKLGHDRFSDHPRLEGENDKIGIHGCLAGRTGQNLITSDSIRIIFPNTELPKFSIFVHFSAKT